MKMFKDFFKREKYIEELEERVEKQKEVIENEAFSRGFFGSSHVGDDALDELCEENLALENKIIKLKVKIRRLEKDIYDLRKQRRCFE